MESASSLSNLTDPSIYFITSNKGQPLLVMNNYVHKLNRESTKKKYWVCTVSGCNIYVHTDLNNNYVSGGKSEHEHPANPELIEVQQTREKIKRRAMKELKPIGMIYDEEMTTTTMSSTAIAVFPTVQEIYQGIAKKRREVHPPIPHSSIFDIPEEYTVTIQKKRFLLFDESRVRRERVLLFSSDVQLDVLFKSSTIYMDGTFSKTPTDFFQLYIIHAVNIDVCVPCVFGLVVDKKASTYKQIFMELKSIAAKKGISFSPSLIMTDFESGVLSAVKTEFPSATHVCCFFHYCQAIYRQVQTLGLQQQYLSNERLRLLCRKLMALALMPFDKVSSSFDDIRTDAQRLPGSPMVQLIKYFESQWMSKIELWNVSGFDSRTNNTCEGYHNRINSRLHRNHPHIWELINFMKAEEKRVENICLQWSAGASKKKNIRTTTIQSRIDTLYRRYGNYLITAFDLLKGLALIVAKKK